MPLLLDVEWEECFLEPVPDPEFERWARSETGYSNTALRYIVPCPWLARATVTLTSLTLAHLDHDQADLVALVVSRDNSCRLCYAGARNLLRLTGMRPKQIDRLEEGLLSAEQQTGTQCAMDFVRRVSRSNPPPSKADQKALIDAGYTGDQIKELAYMAAIYVAINRITTFTTLPPQRGERMADGWRMNVARFFLQGVLTQRRRPAQAEFLTDELKQVPFAANLRGLDGLPGARKLLEILNQAWESPLLTRRAKALAFAVVARGLESRACEQEAFRLLAEQGLDAGQVEDILAHLGSPELDATETTIVRFARETTWYQPAPIQRQARQVHEQLGAAAFLELVGITSFANAITRLAFVLDPT
ncbi:MAG: carboxymuconolactone decarboxylase family protein [Deltaproteobacteria bacterium]|nr:carboxymuconolactone decarboxylase family protein [Deltaproteobacteria bacterium]